MTQPPPELGDLFARMREEDAPSRPVLTARDERDEQEREAQIDVPYPKDGIPQLVFRADDTVVVPSVAELQRTVLLVGAIPTWPYSRGWGYYPSGGVGLLLLILIILLLTGRI